MATSIHQESHGVGWFFPSSDWTFWAPRLPPSSAPLFVIGLVDLDVPSNMWTPTSTRFLFTTCAMNSTRVTRVRPDHSFGPSINTVGPIIGRILISYQHPDSDLAKNPPFAEASSWLSNGLAE